MAESSSSPLAAITTIAPPALDTSLNMSAGRSTKPAVASHLTFQDLRRYLPKELREKVYAAYLQPPKNSFVDPDSSGRLETIVALRVTNPKLFEEITYVAKRISSIPQRIALSLKQEKDAFLEGFPKQLMFMTDWLSVRYIVIKITYYDCSIRAQPDDVTQSVRLSMPYSMGVAWNRVRAIQDENSYLGQLTKVRYDMTYDEAHADEEDNAEDKGVDEAGGSFVKKGNHVMPLSDLIKMFPLAKSVWAEPVGSIENPRCVQTVRAVNLGRRVFDRCSPTSLVLHMVTGLAAKGEQYNMTDFIWREDDKKCVKQAAQFLELVKKDDYMVKEEINIEIICKDCHASFKGDRPVLYYPEEKCLTRRLYKEHCQRSTRTHGAAAPCPDLAREHVELE